jgi:hypothetical protein
VRVVREWMMLMLMMMMMEKGPARIERKEGYSLPLDLGG